MKRALLIAALISIVLVIGWLIVRDRLVASMGYSFVGTFSEMPNDDSELTAWLIQQPGIVETSVHLRREAEALYIDFIQVRTLAGRPAIPNFNQQAAILGYKDGHGFRDVR